jgi:hypothetical protein
MPSSAASIANLVSLYLHNRQALSEAPLTWVRPACLALGTGSEERCAAYRELIDGGFAKYAEALAIPHARTEALGGTASKTELEAPAQRSLRLSHAADLVGQRRMNLALFFTRGRPRVQEPAGSYVLEAPPFLDGRHDKARSRRALCFTGSA